MRPALIGVLLVTDAAVVALLAIERPNGWPAPLVVFSLLLCGLVWLETWAIRHMHDDD